MTLIVSVTSPICSVMSPSETFSLAAIYTPRRS